jgi:hypothetical protein
MNLWLIERADRFGWDEYLGFVICADSEARARAIAAAKHADEGASTWTDEAKSKVRYLGKPAEGLVEGIVLESFNAG